MSGIGLVCFMPAISLLVTVSQQRAGVAGSDGGLEAKAFDIVHGADERGGGGVGWEGEYGMVGMEEGCCYCNVQSAAAAAAAKWQQEERVRYAHAKMPVD